MSQEVVDWNKLTAPKLKEELKKRGLPQTGNKAELVSRLQQDDAEQTNTVQEVEDTTDADAESAAVEEQAEGEEVAERDEEMNETAHEVYEVEDDEAEEEEGKEEEEAEPNNGDEAEQAEGKEAATEAEESKEGEEAKTDGGAEDEKKKKEAETEELYKQIEKDFFIDMPRESDTMNLTWNSNKFTVPFLSEVQKDLCSEMKGRGFMVHPLELSDVRSDVFTQLVDSCLKFSISFFERSAGKTNNGSAKFVFGTSEEATQAQEELKALKEELTFEELKFEYKESEEDIVPAAVKLPASSARPIVHRLLYVGSLPNDVSEPTLRELFPDALRVIIPHKGNEENAENTERNRYAYIEYETEESTTKAAEEHKEATLNDEKIFVIPAMSVRKEKFGLLSNTLRLILIDKTRKLKRIVKNPYNKSSFELKEMEKSITQNMEKLAKDGAFREAWGMPLGRLEASKVDEEDPNASTSTHRGVRGGNRGGNRGRGGQRGGSNQQAGRNGGRGGNVWSPQRGGYSGNYNSGYGSGGGYGGGAGGYRRGGGPAAGGYYGQSFGSPGFVQPFNAGYNNYAAAGGFGGGYGGMKRRADDNLQGGDWKRARGGRGRFY